MLFQGSKLLVSGEHIDSMRESCAVSVCVCLCVLVPRSLVLLQSCITLPADLIIKVSLRS